MTPTTFASSRWLPWPYHHHINTVAAAPPPSPLSLALPLLPPLSRKSRLWEISRLDRPPEPIQWRFSDILSPHTTVWVPQSCLQSGLAPLTFGHCILTANAFQHPVPMPWQSKHPLPRWTDIVNSPPPVPLFSTKKITALSVLYWTFRHCELAATALHLAYMTSRG